jgi:DNA/RNA-binding domain of Phe-tRNA-synthetase-like protein
MDEFILEAKRGDVMHFRYHQTIIEKYPALRGGVILAQGLRNGPTPPELRTRYQAEQLAVKSHLGDSLAEIPALAAWRRVFSSFGVKPTQYRSAAEALLRRLSKEGDIPCINCLVDLGNLVSIRYALPVAIFDTQAIAGAMTVCFAAGHERFTPLGATEVENPEPGEVIFVDEAGCVSARRWCWRQSHQSAATTATTAAIITVEGHHADAASAVRAALDDLLALLHEFAGPDINSHAAVLSPTQPEIRT